MQRPWTRHARFLLVGRCNFFPPADQSTSPFAPSLADGFPLYRPTTGESPVASRLHRLRVFLSFFFFFFFPTVNWPIDFSLCIVSADGFPCIGQLPANRGFLQGCTRTRRVPAHCASFPSLSQARTRGNNFFSIGRKQVFLLFSLYCSLSLLLRKTIDDPKIVQWLVDCPLEIIISPFAWLFVLFSNAFTFVREKRRLRSREWRKRDFEHHAEQRISTENFPARKLRIGS